MIDKEKVLKGLECCTEHDVGKCLKCPYGECLKCPHGVGLCHPRLAADVLELLKEQRKQRFFVDSDGKITPLPIQPQWISVEERLPETCHAVLVYTPHHKNIWAASMHEDGNWYIWSPGGKVLLDTDWHGPITHWMPLPEPPKEAKQDET